MFAWNQQNATWFKHARHLIVVYVWTVDCRNDSKTSTWLLQTALPLTRPERNRTRQTPTEDTAATPRHPIGKRKKGDEQRGTSRGSHAHHPPSETWRAADWFGTCRFWCLTVASQPAKAAAAVSGTPGRRWWDEIPAWVASKRDPSLTEDSSVRKPCCKSECRMESPIICRCLLPY